MASEKAALIVIDVQNGFVTDGSRHVIPVIVDLVDRWERAGHDVVFTRYINYPGSPYERIIKWSELMDSPQIDIVPELIPYAAKATAIIDKSFYSLFADAKGRELAEKRGWTDVYVCGLDTESCVLKTAVDAFELGFTPWFIENASASHNGDKTHAAGVLVTRRFIGPGQIINVADIPEHVLPHAEQSGAASPH